MLRVAIHSGALDKRTVNNKLATLDIAYAKRAALSDYLVALTLRGEGEKAPNRLENYPRWSSSLWDLVARALVRVLYNADDAPSAGKPDKRCAYATRICATIERALVDDRGLELATVEIAQSGKERGVYTARFEEDILGERTADFEFGKKALNPAELLLRAICWAYYGKDTLGPRPSLALAPAMTIDGVERLHIDALPEPARTGFIRYLRETPGVEVVDPLAKAHEYVRFLMKA